MGNDAVAEKFGATDFRMSHDFNLADGCCFVDRKVLYSTDGCKGGNFGSLGVAGVAAPWSEPVMPLQPHPKRATTA